MEGTDRATISSLLSLGQGLVLSQPVHESKTISAECDANPEKGQKGSPRAG